MMINYVEKGRYMHRHIRAAGHTIVNENGFWVTSDDVAVQALIDTFDPLPDAKADAIERVKTAAAEKYAQYASNAPGKDAVYAAKQAEAQARYNAGAYDGPVGPYMQARVNRTAETANAITDEWLAKATAWNALAAAIDAAQDNASALINAETDWTAVAGVADAAIAELEALG